MKKISMARCMTMRKCGKVSQGFNDHINLIILTRGHQSRIKTHSCKTTPACKCTWHMHRLEPRQALWLVDRMVLIGSWKHARLGMASSSTCHFASCRASFTWEGKEACVAAMAGPLWLDWMQGGESSSSAHVITWTGGGSIGRSMQTRESVRRVRIPRCKKAQLPPDDRVRTCECFSISPVPSRQGRFTWEQSQQLHRSTHTLSQHALLSLSPSLPFSLYGIQSYQS
jgi:hypothetical protein